MIPANGGDFINIDQLCVFLLDEIFETGIDIAWCITTMHLIQLASDIVTKSELLTEAKQEFESLLAECLMFCQNLLYITFNSNAVPLLVVVVSVNPFDVERFPLQKPSKISTFFIEQNCQCGIRRITNFARICHPTCRIHNHYVSPSETAIRT
jgi:hypothetical protein